MKRKLVTLLLAGTMLFTQASVAMASEADTTAASETVETTDAATLSEDIYSFQFLLDGEFYQLPMSYEEFTSKGWECQDELTDLEPNSYGMYRFKKGDLQVYAYAVNLGINTLPADQCPIGELSIEDYYAEEAPGTTFELPKGIVFGESTLDDVLAAYGTPSDRYDGDNYTSVTYEYDYYQEVEIYVDNETGTISEVSVQNFVADENTNSASAAELSEEPTEAVAAYQAPTELGADLESYTVEYAGDLYQLPAPVASFVENGWTIKPDSEEYISGKSSGRVVLMKDNQELTTYTVNYDANAVLPINSFVTEIETSEFGPNLSLSLPLGISNGMSEEELLKALEGITYEADTEGSELFSYYNIEDPDNYRNSYCFMVKKETGIVTDIEMSHDPK